MGLVEKVKDFEWQGLARAVRPNSGNHRELQGEDEGDEEQGIASPNAAPRKRKASRKGRWLSFDEDNVQTNTIIRGQPVCGLGVLRMASLYLSGSQGNWADALQGFIIALDVLLTCLHRDPDVLLARCTLHLDRYCSCTSVFV